MAQILRIDKAGCRPAPVGVGHGVRRDVALIGDKDLRPLNPGGGLPYLAIPVEAGGFMPLGQKRPARAGGDIGIAARIKVKGPAIHPQRQQASGDEEHMLRPLLGIGRICAAAGLHFHHILAEGLGKAGQGARDHPEPGLAPAGQKAGDDIGKAAAWDDGIGIGENRALGHERCLRRQAALRGVIAHGSMSFRRSAAIRSTWAQAVVNSVSVSLASRW